MKGVALVVAENDLSQGIDSAADDLFTSDDANLDADWFGGYQAPDSPADIIDAEIIDEPAGKHSRIKSERPAPLERSAKTGPPNIDEWMHFFSKVCIRLATDWYLEFAFRGIDEDLLSDREIEKIRLEDEERDRIARPFAEYANKAKFTRKHGRMIIASADSIDAALQLGIWFSRVNRIANKYRGTTNTTKGTTRHPRFKPAAQQHTRAAPIFRPEPRIRPVVPVETESVANVSVGSDQQAASNGHTRVRHEPAGPVFNPGSG
jgi:hypothetical protein